MVSRALLLRAAQPAMGQVHILPACAPALSRSYATTKQPTASSQFYKQFTRPIAKVLLLAVFTYQFAYWGWTKLETDEIRAERDGEPFQYTLFMGAALRRLGSRGG
jgi:hypothetical protein